MFAGAVALLSSACFSPQPYTEHLCRTCVSECPDGLVCHDQRCVRACDASCVGEYECQDGACGPSSGAEQCPASVVKLALCVGRAVEASAGMPAESSSVEPWVVLDSRLPEGVSFDPETGAFSGTPTRAEPGSLTVRHGEPGSEELSVDLLATEHCPAIVSTTVSWCRGATESTRLEASLPGDYEWSVSSLPPGVAQQGDALTGAVAEVGSYGVRLALLDQGRVVDEALLELEVTQCDAPPTPVAPLEIVTLAALPDACEGVTYAAAFNAVGGVPAYRWALASAPAGLELDEASGRLSGVPLASGDFELGVSVEDSAGSRDAIGAALHVASAADACSGTGQGVVPSEQEACVAGEAPACPRAPLDIVTRDLGVLCAGAEYSARLEASGGGGDYSWTLWNAPPSGLELEETGELHGVPGADAIGRHSLGVSLASTFHDVPVSATVTLEVALCDSIVFVTGEASAGRLILSSPGTGVAHDLSESVVGAGQSVHAFALAPDGAHLAFDVVFDLAEGTLGKSLYSVDVGSLEVQAATFEPALPDGASLIDYRWSLDARSLAATFRQGERVFLGVSAAAGGPGSLIEVSGRYLTGLFWAGDRICYVAPGVLPQLAAVFCHAMTPEGLDDQAPQTGNFAQSALRSELLLSSDEGYLALLSDARSAQYLLPADMASSASHIGRVFSPGLHRAAGPSGEPSISEVYTARAVSRAPALLARLDPCDEVDAWSLDERWLACRSGGSLSVHQLGADGALVSGGVVPGSEGYPQEEFRRLWAPAGQWYAYVADRDLWVVPLGAAPGSARRAFEAGVQGGAAGLGADAAGQRLFYHHGSDLEVIDTHADLAVRNVNGRVLLSDPPSCNEEQLDEGPRFWCGAQSTPAFFFPAPAAPRVAFVDRESRLYVADLEPFAAPRLVHDSAVKCTSDSGETACDLFVQWVHRRASR